MLDIGVLTATGLKEWAAVMMSAVRHKQEQSPHACISLGADIKVRLAKKQRFELDGGAKGKARTLRYRIVPQSLVTLTQ